MKPATDKPSLKANLFRAAAAIWALLTLILCAIPEQYYKKIVRLSSNMAVSLFGLLFSSSDTDGLIKAADEMAWVGLVAVFGAILALLVLLAQRIYYSDFKWIIILNVIIIAAIIGAGEGIGMAFGDPFQALRLLAGISGGIVALLAAFLFLRLMRRYPGLLNRETISYVFFGFLTTVVNIVAYGLCYNNIGLHNLISNAVAWVAAVLFAFIVNKLYVFQSHTETAAQALREFGLFIAARLLSFGVDELMMWIMVDVSRINGGVSKIAVNIVVLIMNYIFSKRIIFKQP
ncbi:MAG: GtrA family protein [Clostridiales bacterium]|jgi:putative flippase GtrA|nr:GtrA family protein [Clostridiales bacterium]